MYSKDLQLATLRTYAKLSSLRETAKLMGISHMTVKRWLSSLERKQRQQRTESKTRMIVDCLRKHLATFPFSTLTELREQVSASLKVNVSKELIRIVLKREGYSWKKIKFYGTTKNLPSQTDLFIQQRGLYISKKYHFISIDETSFGRHGKVVKGFTPKGVKHSQRKRYPRVTTTTALCCLDRNGTFKYRLHKGAVDSPAFLNFMKFLDLQESTVILLDNCKIHHTRLIKDYAKEKNLTLLYTPPYSPLVQSDRVCFLKNKETIL